MRKKKLFRLDLAEFYNISLKKKLKKLRETGIFQHHGAPLIPLEHDGIMVTRCLRGRASSSTLSHKKLKTYIWKNIYS